MIFAWFFFKSIWNKNAKLHRWDHHSWGADGLLGDAGAWIGGLPTGRWHPCVFCWWFSVEMWNDEHLKIFLKHQTDPNRSNFRGGEAGWTSVNIHIGTEIIFWKGFRICSRWFGVENRRAPENSVGFSRQMSRGILEDKNFTSDFNLSIGFSDSSGVTESLLDDF